MFLSPSEYILYSVFYFFPSFHWPSILHIGQNNHLSVYLQDQFNQPYRNITAILNHITVSSSLYQTLSPVFNEEVMLFNLLENTFTGPLSSVSVEIRCVSETDGMIHTFSNQLSTDQPQVFVYDFTLDSYIGHLIHLFL